MPATPADVSEASEANRTQKGDACTPPRAEGGGWIYNFNLRHSHYKITIKPPLILTPPAYVESKVGAYNYGCVHPKADQQTTIYSAHKTG